MMSVYYKHPVLLIEFEEDKAFSLEVSSTVVAVIKDSMLSSALRC